MKKGLVLIFVPLILGILGGAVSAGDKRDIELTDGSVISGEIVSYADGIYTINTKSLGTVRVEAGKIRALRSRAGQAGSGERTVPSQAEVTGQIQALQQQVMGDSEIMNMILSLANDPEFRKVLEDPDIVRAVNAGDIEALMSNPTFMKLLGHPRIRDIRNKVVK